MKAITTAIPEQLSSDDVEELHETSREWLNEISFMKDEISFLDALLTRHSSHHFPTIASTELGSQLTSLNTNLLSVINRKIVEHEMWLSDAVRTDTVRRQKIYHEIHGELARQMKQFGLQFRLLKKRIYSFMRRKF